MRAKQKWLLSTLLVSSLGAQVVPHSALAEPEPAKAPDETQIKNDKAAAAFIETPAEVVSEETADRTLYSKEYLMSDNSRETVLSAAPLHYRDDNGDYQDIRLSLTLEEVLPEKESAPKADVPAAADVQPAESTESESTPTESKPQADSPAAAPEAAPEAESDAAKPEVSALRSLSSASLAEPAAEAPAAEPAKETPAQPAPSADELAAETPAAPQPAEDKPAPAAEEPQAPAAEPSSAPAAPSAEPGYTSATVPYTPSLHNAYAQGFSLGANGSTVGLVPVGAQDAQADVSQSASGQLSYANVWNSTDANLALAASGVEQTLNLASADAPATFRFEVQGPLGADLTSGSLAVSPAWLTDANGQRREARQTLREDSGVRYLDVEADHRDLAYPVELHTGIMLQTTAQTATVTAEPSESAEASAGMRTFARSAPKPLDRHTYLQFDLSGLPEDAAVREAYLTSAAGGEAGNPDTLRVLRAVEPWNEATLTSDEQPRTALRADGASYGKLRTDESGQPRIDLDPDLITRWLTDEQPNYGVQIDSAGEPTSFAEAPQLHIRHGGDAVSTLSAAGTPMQFQYFYDDQSRLQYILFSSGERINFTYDTNGNLIKREYVQGF